MSSSTCFWRSVIASVRDDRVPYRVGLTGFENSGLDVEHLGGNPQRLRDLVEHFGGRFAQSALDLAQIRIADAGLFGQLTHRHLRRFTLRSG